MAFQRAIVVVLPLVLLAACNSKQEAKNDKRSASGEVLEGTISDSMLPLEQLQSKPPLLVPSKAPTTPEAIDDAATGADTASSEAPAETATPAPSGTP